jgi:hypothetical protein
MHTDANLHRRITLNTRIIQVRVCVCVCVCVWERERERERKRQRTQKHTHTHTQSHSPIYSHTEDMHDCHYTQRICTSKTLHLIVISKLCEVYFVVALFYRRFPTPSLTVSGQAPRNHSSKSCWCVCGSLPSPEDPAYGNEACANDEIIKSSLQAPTFRKHWIRLYQQWTATLPAASLKTSHFILNTWFNISDFPYPDLSD